MLILLRLAAALAPVGREDAIRRGPALRAQVLSDGTVGTAGLDGSWTTNHGGHVVVDGGVATFGSGRVAAVAASDGRVALKGWALDANRSTPETTVWAKPGHRNATWTRNATALRTALRARVAHTAPTGGEHAAALVDVRKERGTAKDYECADGNTAKAKTLVEAISKCGNHKSKGLKVDADLAEEVVQFWTSGWSTSNSGRDKPARSALMLSMRALLLSAPAAWEQPEILKNKTAYGVTPLHLAFATEDAPPEVLQAMLAVPDGVAALKLRDESCCAQKPSRSRPCCGSTPLNYAAANSGFPVEVWKTILALTEGVEALGMYSHDEGVSTSLHGTTPLHSLFLEKHDEAQSQAGSSRLEVLKLLLGHEEGRRALALPDKQSDNTPVHEAAKSRQPHEVFRELLDYPEGRRTLNKLNGKKETPLYVAARESYVDTWSTAAQVIETMVAEPEGREALTIVDGSGDLPLHAALIFRLVPAYPTPAQDASHAKVIKALLSKPEGLKALTTKSSTAMTPLHYATKKSVQYHQVVMELLRQPEGRDALIMQDTQAATTLASHHARKSSKSSSHTFAEIGGDTPLHYALADPKTPLEVFRLLLTYPQGQEAMKICEVKYGFTPLHMLLRSTASRSVPDLEVLKLMLASKAGQEALKMTTQGGVLSTDETPLLYAARRLQRHLPVEVFQEILAYPEGQATLTHVDSQYKMAPLHWLLCACQVNGCASIGRGIEREHKDERPEICSPVVDEVARTLAGSEQGQEALLQKDGSMQTPMGYARRLYNWETVADTLKALLGLHSSEQLIIYAAESGAAGGQDKTKRINELLSAHPELDIDQRSEKWKYTALMAATMADDKEMVRFLLDNGAKIETSVWSTSRGKNMTAMDLAIAGSMEESMKVLSGELQHTADTKAAQALKAKAKAEKAKAKAVKAEAEAAKQQEFAETASHISYGVAALAVAQLLVVVYLMRHGIRDLWRGVMKSLYISTWQPPRAEAALAVPVAVARGDLTELDDGEPVFRPPGTLPQVEACRAAQQILERRLRYRAQAIESHRGAWTQKQADQAVLAASFRDDEASAVRRLVAHEARYLESFAEAATSEDMLPFLATTVSALSTKYRGVYESVQQQVVKKQHGYDDVVAAAQRFADRNKKCVQPLLDATDAVALMEQAAISQCRTSEFAKRLAESTHGRSMGACLKHIYRIVEKACFDGKCKGTSPAVDGALDCAREAVEFDTMKDMLNGLEFLEAAERNGEIELLRGKNRWANPTSGGWADCLVNFRFQAGPAAGHICELQVVHAKMMVVRSKMGAHHEYAIFRAAAELLAYHELQVTKRREARGL